jgi:hypothetical protein
MQWYIYFSSGFAIYMRDYYKQLIKTIYGYSQEKNVLLMEA